MSAYTGRVVCLPMGLLPIQGASRSPDSTYTILVKKMGSGEGRKREGGRRGPCTAELSDILLWSLALGHGGQLGGGPMCTPLRGGCGAPRFQPFLRLKCSLLLGAQTSQEWSHVGHPFSGPLPTCAYSVVESGLTATGGTQRAALRYEEEEGRFGDRVNRRRRLPVVKKSFKYIPSSNYDATHRHTHNVVL